VYLYIVYGGIEKSRALFFNLITASGSRWVHLYCSSRLVPELHKETEKWKTIFSFLSFLAGIALMWFYEIYIRRLKLDGKIFEKQIAYKRS